MTKQATVAAIDSTHGSEGRNGHVAPAAPIRHVSEGAKGRGRAAAKLRAVADARVTVKIPRKRAKAR